MKAAKSKKASVADSGDDLLAVLEARFAANMSRHAGLDWGKIKARLESSPDKLKSLQEMEATGGEPDVIGQDRPTGKFVFADCSAESPKGRTSLCYDRAALDSRKEFKPKSSAMERAAAMGIELLTEEQYLELQTLGEFDTKSSSWLKTTDDFRKRGGAIFGDRRFGRVFIYHNGADSYYAGRGFRGRLEV